MVSFSVTFISAYSIKCYVCGPKTDDTCTKDNLEKDNKYVKSCSAGTNQCIRTWAKVDDITTIQNLCGNDAACTTIKELCDKSSKGKCAVGCCDTDLCNAGSPVSFSLFLITVSPALVLALLK